MKLTNCMSVFLFVTGLSTSLVRLPAKAEKVCQVTDPTGTPLNVRNKPNGRIINTLSNGDEVYIIKTINDGENRSWAKVSGYDKGEHRALGWVFREFISCYNR